ncbi:Hypothetical protein I595_1046 [Croceitalea dokdonensis DOKDO 023]|uniref:Uncharacterized protein n=1 Tax=Croceitalea dokdonensis DOKDO 023 TaxID=1300341 RepID=A0A0N8H479_9FLAO|nr:Hypothetical protein I595_1046 [Croceitalea dokdonensis DOKDO 023]
MVNTKNAPASLPGRYIIELEFFKLADIFPLNKDLLSFWH